MGGAASQPSIAVPKGSQAMLNVNQLASLASRYNTLRIKLNELYDEQKIHVDDLEDQRAQFRQELETFQKDFEGKLAEQQKRNADLNARDRNIAGRNAELKRKLGEIEAKQAMNTSSAANAKNAAVKAASAAAAAERFRLEEIYKKELAEIETPLKAAREEFTRLSGQVQNVQGKVAEASALNQNIVKKRTNLAGLEAEIIAAAQKVKDEEGTLETRRKEVMDTLEREVNASRQSKIEALNLELQGIREGAEREKESLLASAKALADQQTAEAAQEIARIRAEEEAARSSRIATEAAEIEKQKLEAARERADIEAKILDLQAKAATDVEAAAKLAQEKQELQLIKAEQAKFEAEKAKILEEKIASQAAVAKAQQEAKEARDAAKAATEAKAVADEEKRIAEKTEKYRKHLYQIIKDWIGPLESKKIKTYHDDETDDYYFEQNGVRKPWVQEQTIQELKRKYPTLRWQPRPSKNTFVGGRRRMTRRMRRRIQRKSRKTRK